MIKKLSTLFLSFSFFVPGVFAVSIQSNFATDLEKKQIQTLSPLSIKAEFDGEITAQYGINILLANDKWILWNEEILELSGSAVENGRVNPDALPTFSPDYKVMSIPVEEDFLLNETLEINGHKVRAYDNDFNWQYLGVDVNGDFLAEASDINGYRVEDVNQSDNTTPYPVYNVSHVLNEAGEVVITWNNPPDYDLKKIRVDRWLITDGIEKYKPKSFYDLDTEYVDTDFEDADAIRYKITAEDFTGHVSEEVELTVSLVIPIEEEVTEVVEEIIEEVLEEVDEEVEATSDEVDEMNRLLNYYNLRYSIKCMPSGEIVAENDSACLWARIDLVYAQEITDNDKVAGLTLSSRDLELMAARRKWPALRYEQNCVAANVAAPYCSSLGRAIQRTAYFLD